MCSVCGPYKTLVAKAQQIILTHQAQDAFVVDYHPLPPQGVCDPAIAVGGYLQGN
jgi:hypothetical protein